MNATGVPLPRRQLRLFVYVLIIGGLFLLRGRFGGQGLLPPLFSGADRDTTFSVAGTDLAPALASGLITDYRRDYPQAGVTLLGGGTNHAMEALLSERADVGLLLRPPSAGEESLSVALHGDSVLCFPVALGAVVCLLGEEVAPDSLTIEEFKSLLAGALDGRCDRLYLPDPNWGLLEDLNRLLDLPSSPAGRHLSFLHSDAEVLSAVRADPRSIGLVTTLAIPLEAMTGVRPARLAPGPDSDAFPPSHQAVGGGDYPLPVHLHAACLPGGNRQGGMFLTYLTSARGQRRVERAGFLPARQVLREVVITRHPVGGAR